MSHRETSNDYRGIVATLDTSTRIITCKDGIQWILQHRRGTEWKSRSYYRQRESLLKLLDPSTPTETREAIAALPRCL